VVEDVMETDNNDEELSSERERERRRKVHWEREREPEVEMHGGKRRLIRFVRGTILRVCSLSLLKRPTLGVRRKRHFMSGCTSREYGGRREREIGRKERERELGGGGTALSLRAVGPLSPMPNRRDAE
jgi:hypothetical protein